MAIRWGKTSGAYKKYHHIFEKQMPIIIPSNAPISDAAVIRDVIAFAAENNLKGSNWHKKVTVSPQEDNTVKILPKPMFQDEFELAVIRNYNLFEVIRAIESKELYTGKKFQCDDELEDIKNLLQTKGFTIRSLGSRIYELIGTIL